MLWMTYANGDQIKTHALMTKIKNSNYVPTEII